VERNKQVRLYIGQISRCIADIVRHKQLKCYCGPNPCPGKMRRVAPSRVTTAMK